MFVLRVRSGVASYGALEHVLPRVLENIDLTVKISKITKEKQVLHFRLARQKHDKTHVNRLKQSRNQKKSRAEEERKNLCCAPHFISWRRHCVYVRMCVYVCMRMCLYMYVKLA